MGPISRVAEFKSIEMTYGAGNLQQLRWPPSNIADTPQQALSRMYMLPGAQYVDPEFSWKYALAPSPIGFVKGSGLGPQFEGDLFVGASRTTLLNGFLFRFKLTADRQHFSFTDSRLADRVADNIDKFDLTESESLVDRKRLRYHNRYSNRAERKRVCRFAFEWRSLRDQVEAFDCVGRKHHAGRSVGFAVILARSVRAGKSFQSQFGSPHTHHDLCDWDRTTARRESFSRPSPT